MNVHGLTLHSTRTLFFPQKHGAPQFERWAHPMHHKLTLEGSLL